MFCWKFGRFLWILERQLRSRFSASCNRMWLPPGTQKTVGAAAVVKGPTQVNDENWEFLQKYAKNIRFLYDSSQTASEENSRCFRNWSPLIYIYICIDWFPTIPQHSKLGTCNLTSSQTILRLLTQVLRQSRRQGSALVADPLTPAGV